MEDTLSAFAVMAAFFAFVAYDTSTGESFPLPVPKTVTVTVPYSVL